jgi:hypothetical protein
MDALEADKGNYLGIEVDDQLAEKQRARALVSRDEDLTKYNRGVVPPEQKVASNRYFYAQEDLSQLVPSGMGELNQHGVFSSRAMHPDANAADDRLASGPGAIAPMRSFGAAGVGGRQQLEAEQPDESQSTALYYDSAQQNMARRAVQKLATKAEMLQVLFVLSSQTPPVPGAASVESATSEPAVSEPDAQPAPATSPATDDPLR